MTASSSRVARLPPVISQRSDPAESIRRNALFGLAARLSSAFFSGALTLYLVRALEPSGYGVFALAVSIGAAVLLVSDFGISQATARFTAERRGKTGELATIIGDGLSLKLFASLIVAALLFGLAEPIASAYGNDDLLWPLRLVAIAVLGQSLMNYFALIFEAVGRNSIGFRLIFSESALEAVNSIALVALGAGVTGAALGRTIGFTFGGLLGLLLVVRLLRPKGLRVGPRPQWGFRPIAGYAGALFVIEGAYALFTEIGTLMIGAILTATAAGLFSAPILLLTIVQYPALALAAGVAPRLARHPDHPPNADAFQTAIRVLILLQLAVMPPLLVWAGPIVDLLLGPGYEGSVGVLRLLAPFAVLAGLAPLLTIAANYAGEARLRIPIAIGGVLINAGVNLILISDLGAKGASIGADAGILFYVAGHLWICVRLLELRLGPVAVSAIRGLLAAAAMSAVLYAFGTDSISLLEGVLGLAAAGAAYLLVLIATRELTRGELSAARQAAIEAAGRLRRLRSPNS